MKCYKHYCISSTPSVAGYIYSLKTNTLYFLCEMHLNSNITAISKQNMEEEWKIFQFKDMQYLPLELLI